MIRKELRALLQAGSPDPVIFSQLQGWCGTSVEGKPMPKQKGAESSLFFGDYQHDLAKAYVYRVHPEDTRIWPRPETEPNGLCSSEHRITFNKEGPGGNKPPTRYGSAANGRGDCLHQIVVSDRWYATSR